MYSIRKEYTQFCNTAYYCVDLLKVKSQSSGKKNLFIKDIYDSKFVYVNSCGSLNTIWQSWNKFWRTYWLTHLYGGWGYSGIIPFNNIGIGTMQSKKIKEGVAIYHLLSSINWNLSRCRSGIVASYLEPTWGDIATIEKISLQHATPGNRILSALSVFGDSAKHLQKVRNCSIHIGKSGILDLKSSVLPGYKLTDIKYPTDILYSEELGGAKMAITAWIDELTAFLELI